MRIPAIVITLAATVAAASALAAPTPAERKIGVETRITFASGGGIRNWQAGPPESGILYMQDRTLKWYKVTLSGPCIETRVGPMTVVYTTDSTGTFDTFSRLTFPDYPGRVCGVKSIRTSLPPAGQPGAPKPAK
ncbi:hypothetical protein ACFO8O_12950 [Hephaestia sp. GCM10023244]|uniref:hypothetical protein n=1 Tax=unclassified Hephaestia TaxID=2631281 RepID=UPI002076EFD7|nr:hypothetical protein [Hephaestia sp. MAHUQ-44]MCM8731869.1 hypothetical protein [Hephaestia sp. MAHUQ-44]